jgi:hypothetical protein
MQPSTTFLRRIVCLLLIGILCGCSTARLAYNNAETVSYFWLNRYVDFDADQKPWVKKEISAFFSWHRQTQLKDYVALLSGAQKQLENPVTEADVQASYDAARERMRIMLDHAAPAMADLTLSLREEQIDHIASRFASNNEDFRSEHLKGSQAQQQEARYRKTLKQAEHWFGRFSAEQRREIRMLSEARPLDNALVLTERIARQQALLDLLRRIRAEKPSRDAAIAMIRLHAARMMEPAVDPDRSAWFARYHAATVHMIANIINNTTLQQRQHCIDELQAWIDNFNSLAPSARTAAAMSGSLPRLD